MTRMNPHGLLLPVAALSRRQRDEMFALMDRHYLNVTPERFHADLREKEWVILLVESESEAVCGFSTQVVLTAEVAGREIKALFSGDTIVARQHRGNGSLARVWGRLALSLMERYADQELYWFLISKGYRTYRFLPVFFREFYPRHDAVTPDWAREVVDALAVRKFPAAYDAAAGIVRAGLHSDSLRADAADLPAERLSDPHVRHFLERNPGHAAGDELCCLAPLTRGNFMPAAWRAIGDVPAPQGVGI